MKKCIYDSEWYYYEYIDGEDGTPIYNGENIDWYKENAQPYTKLDNWEYDEWTSQENFETIVNELDAAKDATEARRFAKVKIDGNLGLWDGRHKIHPEEEDSWKEAIDRCIGRDIEDFEIYQSGKYTIYIDAHHHDGTNRFKLTCYI